MFIWATETRTLSLVGDGDSEAEYAKLEPSVNRLRIRIFINEMDSTKLGLLVGTITVSHPLALSDITWDWEYVAIHEKQQLIFFVIFSRFKVLGHGPEAEQITIIS